MSKPHVYNPLEDFHLYPMANAQVFSDRRVYACDMPMVYGAATKRGRVLWRKAWKRERK